MLWWVVLRSWSGSWLVSRLWLVYRFWSFSWLVSWLGWWRRLVYWSCWWLIYLLQNWWLLINVNWRMASINDVRSLLWLLWRIV